MARFQREAQVLASFNRPNIASIYGVDAFDGKRALVLEHVEGRVRSCFSRTRGEPTICRRVAFCRAFSSL
jgi:serine/threonine protein kinase